MKWLMMDKTLLLLKIPIVLLLPLIQSISHCYRYNSNTSDINISLLVPKSTLKHVHIDAEIMLFICRPCQSFQFVEFWAGEAMVSKVVSHSGRDVASLDIDYFKPDPSGRYSTNYYDVLTSSGFAYLWLNFCKCFCCLGALKTVICMYD